MKYQIVPSLNLNSGITTYHVMAPNRLTPVAITGTKAEAEAVVFVFERRSTVDREV